MTITAEGERGMEGLCQAMWDAQETQLVGYAEDFEPFVRAVLLALRDNTQERIDWDDKSFSNLYAVRDYLDAILSERTEGEN